MHEIENKPSCAEKCLIIHPHDLPLSCPMDDMTLWNAHPKIYLPIEQTKEEICPYCGTRYVLQDE